MFVHFTFPLEPVNLFPSRSYIGIFFSFQTEVLLNQVSISFNIQPKKNFFFFFAELQSPVVQSVDSTIHRINHYPVDKCWKKIYAIHWIVVYPVDSVFHPLNNRGQLNTRYYYKDSKFQKRRSCIYKKKFIQHSTEFN